jgi:hypothetical protein
MEDVGESGDGKTTLMPEGEVARAMPSRAKRAGLVALLAGVAFAALASGQVLPEDGRFVAIEDGPCWDCHKADSPVPLRAFVNVVPTTSFHVPEGQEVQYSVEIQNAWLSEIRYLAATLDLTNAPSLTFGGGPADIVGQTVDGVIPIDPTTITEPQTDSVEIPVEAGAVSMSISLAPQATGATGPDLDMVVYAPLSGPDAPFREAPDTGPGATETLEFTLEEIAEGGLGNWTVEAMYSAVKNDATPPASPPPGTEIPYVVTYSITFDTAGLRKIEIVREVTMVPKGGELLNWGVAVRGVPVEGETVNLTLNHTAYYKHPPGKSDDDWGYTASRPLVLDVRANETEGGVDLIVPAGSNTVFSPPGNIPVSIDRISEAVGYLAGFLLISSVWSGGMFGKASRRQMNTLFGSAKRRVAFHNFLSYGIMLAAAAHTVIFIIETQYHWTLGLIWGGLAILAMVGLGLTGALQVAMIRKWSYGFWRWSHYGLAVATIVFTIVHILLDGANFGSLQESIGWTDPLDRREVAI